MAIDLSVKIIKSFHSLAVMFALLIGLTLSGCISPASSEYRYYNLKSSPKNLPDVDGAAVLLADVTLPQYLLRPQITTRSDSNLHFAEFDRWAEPLDVNIARFMRRRLCGDLAEHSMKIAAGSADKYKYKLSLNFERFEAEAGKFTTLAYYSVTDAESGRIFTGSTAAEIADCPAANYKRICECAVEALNKISETLVTKISEME